MDEMMILACEEKMEKAIEQLKKNLNKVRTGRANPSLTLIEAI